MSSADTKTRFLALNDVAGRVSRETFDRLEAFQAEFRRWSGHFNLAAPSTLGALWERHVLDSAQLVKIAPAARRWLDLGSGGGFPGAVVAILMADENDGHVDLIESNGKKAAFLSTVLRQLDAPATVHRMRIEEAVGHLAGRPQIVTARALAPLPKLLELSEPWIAGETRALFHKGRDYRAEIEESRAKWRYDLVEHRSALGSDSVIIEITHLRQTTADDPGESRAPEI